MTRDGRPIVVVGSGVIGLCTALHLRAASTREIVVLEAGEIGTGTTSAGAGFVAPWATVLPHLGAAGRALIEYSLGYFNAAAAAGVDLQHRANGNIVFFSTEESMAAAVAAVTAGPEWSDENQVLDAREVGNRTSGIVDPDRIAGGIWMPRGIQLDTKLLLAHLARRAAEADIEVREHTSVTTIERSGEKLAALVVESESTSAGPSSVVETDCAVLAVGAWLNRMLGPLGVTLPVMPFVATRFVTEPASVPDTMPTLQGKDFPLWIRESSGGFTWGTTPGCAPAHRLGRDWTSFDRSTRWRDDLASAMLADTNRVAEAIPSLATTRVREAIQGMPVYTVDRQFVLGEVPGCAGLWAVGGDNESGVSHGPGLGRLAADLMTERDRPLCDATPYRLDRFSPDGFGEVEALERAFSQSGVGFIAEALARPVRV